MGSPQPEQRLQAVVANVDDHLIGIPERPQHDMIQAEKFAVEAGAGSLLVSGYQLQNIAVRKVLHPIHKHRVVGVDPNPLVADIPLDKALDFLPVLL